MVVDDERDTVETVMVVLEVSGYDVRPAHDGAEALSVAQIFEPEIVLLDIQMPDLLGYEVARRLRATDAAVQIIAFTALRKHRSLEPGPCEAIFDDYLLKPSTSVQLRTALRAASERRQRAVLTAGV